PRDGRSGFQTLLAEQGCRLRVGCRFKGLADRQATRRKGQNWRQGYGLCLPQFLLRSAADQRRGPGRSVERDLVAVGPPGGRAWNCALPHGRATATSRVGATPRWPKTKIDSPDRFK